MAAAATTSRELMGPPPARAPRHLISTAQLIVLPGESGQPKAVLPEEDYTAGIEAIIERDYFPDIPKLRNQLEWAQAVNSGDPSLIRAAQINIARRRAGLMTPAPSSMRPHTASTPLTAWGETPGTAALRTPAMTPLAGLPGAPGSTTPAIHTHTHAVPASSAAAGTPFAGATPGPTQPAHHQQPALASSSGPQLRAPPMSLDTFLATHTSEDNASFLRIQDKHNARKRARIAHLLEDPAARAASQRVALQQAQALASQRATLLEEPGPPSVSNPTDEFGTGGQEPMTLVPVKHHPATGLYYIPEQQPLSVEQAADLAKAPPKAINIQATRLSAEAEQAATAATAAAAAAAAAVTAHRQGLEPASAADAARAAAGLPPLVSAGQGSRDWNRMATPSMTPGAMGASPLMTWGDLASTPLRLDGMDEGVLDLHSMKGPSFHVPSMPKREAAGHQLASAKTISALRKLQRAAKQAEEWGVPQAGRALPPGAGAVLTGGLGSVSVGRGTTGGTPGTAGRQVGPGGTPLRTPGGSTPAAAGLAGMSAAAQKLAQVMKAKRAGLAQLQGGTPHGADLDRMLRASYSGARPASGVVATPGRGHGTSTPALGAGAAGATPIRADGAAAQAALSGAGDGLPPKARKPAKQVVAVGMGSLAVTSSGKGLTDGLLNL